MTSETQDLTPVSLVAHVPKDFIPVQTLIIMLDAAGRVRFDGEGSPFAYPAVVARMASELLGALSYSLTLGPTVSVSPQVTPTHQPGRA